MCRCGGMITRNPVCLLRILWQWLVDIMGRCDIWSCFKFDLKRNKLMHQIHRATIMWPWCDKSSDCGFSQPLECYRWYIDCCTLYSHHCKIKKFSFAVRYMCEVSQGILFHGPMLSLLGKAMHMNRFLIGIKWLLAYLMPDNCLQPTNKIEMISNKIPFKKLLLSILPVVHCHFDQI